MKIAGIIADHKLKTVHREEITTRSDLERIIMDDYDFYVMSNELITIDDIVVFTNEEWSIVKGIPNRDF